MRRPARLARRTSAAMKGSCSNWSNIRCSSPGAADRDAGRLAEPRGELLLEVRHLDLAALQRRHRVVAGELALLGAEPLAHHADVVLEVDAVDLGPGPDRRRRAAR